MLRSLVGSEMCIRDRYKILLKYKKIWFKYKTLEHGPYGPRAPGPRALPCWANTSPKNAPWKKESKLCFLFAFWKQKRCAASVRSFWRRYRAEISAMCQKTKVSVLRKIILCPFSENMCQIHCKGCQILTSRSFLADAYGIGPGSAPRDLPSTCAGGQDDVSSQANSLKLIRSSVQSNSHLPNTMAPPCSGRGTPMRMP